MLLAILSCTAFIHQLHSGGLNFVRNEPVAGFSVQWADAIVLLLLKLLLMSLPISVWAITCVNVIYIDSFLIDMVCNNYWAIFTDGYNLRFGSS